MEMGISGLGSPRKATNELSRSVRINFCRTLKSSKKKKKIITTTKRLGEESSF